MEKTFFTANSRQTKELGKFLAKESLKTGVKKKKGALVLGLEGDLGGGKTTFLQGFARGLGIKERITSPTFVIMKRFKLSNCPIVQFSNFYHIDCYRLQKPKEILMLGFKMVISDPKNIVAIEWAEKIKKLLPKNIIWLKFGFLSKSKRKISFKNLWQKTRN